MPNTPRTPEQQAAIRIAIQAFNDRPEIRVLFDEITAARTHIRENEEKIFAAQVAFLGEAVK